MRVMVTRLLLVAAVALVLRSERAEACGCFAPPDPSVPIVQAGERILFSVENGVVNAHIQIQYAGEAKDFGWLLPLPSVPTLKLGTEELFSQLISATQPRYLVKTITTGSCSGGGLGGGLAFAASVSDNSFQEFGGSGAPPPSPLVIQSSIGPYDYAVLKADRKDEMLRWLTDNRYFIPVGTDDVVGPYIRPGAFFLALKLKSGQAAGDIQPVVLEYPSDLPMIPIILTSVAAQPNMGIQVWMLGAGRAIPRNYNHVIVNDSQIDWLANGKNYNDVIIRAVGEAPEKHAFVTEYAGTSDVMKDVLDGPTRFGNTMDLATLTNPADFVSYLFSHGYAPNSSMGGRTLPPLLKSLVLAQVSRPSNVPSTITDDQFLSDINRWRPSFTMPIDSAALAALIEEKIVVPAREAGALFLKHPSLTRLYTTLSPEDMTRDPVFSFNPSLADVPRDHNATLRVDCGLGGNFSTSPATLTTEQGWVFNLENRNAAIEAKGPGALRIETVGEEGPPVVLTDNAKLIANKVGCGCSTVDPLLAWALLALLARRRSLRIS
jgi:hypothetical protein